MKWLTKQEQLVVGILLVLLLTGVLVKNHRAAHPAPTVPGVSAPPVAAGQPAKS